MDKAQQEFLINKVHLILASLGVGSSDKTEITLRFEGEKLRDVDLQRHLSKAR